MQKILEHIVPEGNTIVKYGLLDKKLIIELKMTTSLYDYIETVTKYYDGDDQYFNNWTDIEGYGYGWVWMRYEEAEWHKMMGKQVACESKRLSKDMDNTLYFVYEGEGVVTYHFVNLNERREDTLISFSNSEMDYS
ncbi:hypothetical protein WKH57_01175 [Niallia taxi]|uniref:hypothetical protein n=1 Tax=Niallia taxi TaxID=2499688 RepID=UPI003181553A